jgi:hypothetical protein
MTTLGLCRRVMTRRFLWTRWNSLISWPQRLRNSPDIETPTVSCLRLLGGVGNYQIALTANWIWRDVVVVDLRRPATPVGEPEESKMSVLSGETGTAKLAWFRMLKNSARNWMLKFSEIFLIALFLNMEKSRFTRPGPVNMLRPALPRRLKHCG